jgi:threonine/homoserine/homoserine lactone efflux protein
MGPTGALITGLITGLAIAMQVGAVSLLLVEAAVVAGPRAGVAAGMGVATADFGFAAIAAAAGGVAGPALSSHVREIRAAGALVLAAIALQGLVALARDRGPSASAAAAGGAPRALYKRFLAITAANPLTIASFAAVAAALTLDSPASAIAFAAGAGAASAGWHLVLTLVAGHAGRWITPPVRRGLGIGGRLVVLVIAAHLALG